MEALSGLDASFLYLETPKLPMHIGSVSILQGAMKLDTLKTFVAQRVHKVPKLTQVLASVPMGLDRPVWVAAQNFDIDQHIVRRSLPAPGGWRELRNLASELFSQPLDRDRPLWEFVLIDGLQTLPGVPKDSFALLSKVHHAGFDGQSGADLMQMLFDLSPTPREPAAKPPENTPREEPPSAAKMLWQGSLNWLKRPGMIPEIIWDVSKAALKTGYLSTVNKITAPTLPFSAPKTPFNAPVKGSQHWDASLLDMARVKAIRPAVPGATVNDVILTICAGALRTYLQEKNALPKQPLVAMVPVSTRTKAEKDSMGNQVSAMYIQLATDVENPLRRLEKIHVNTLVGKLYQDAMDARSLMQLAELIPFGLAGVATRLYTQSGLASRHKPAVNVVITNVPGPPVPVYLAGHKLLANMGTAPIFDGVALMMPIFSYNGSLSISAISATDLMPDLSHFCKLVRASANELEKEALERIRNRAAFNALLEKK